MKQPEVRICMDCDQPTLIPVSRDIQIYSSSIRYKCETCEAKIEIQPLASIGVLITVGLLVLAFWWYILFARSSDTDIIGTSIYIAAVLALVCITGIPLLAHIMNPVAKNPDRELPDLTVNSEHIAKKLILYLEKFGLLGGLIAPLILLLLAMGIVFIIGYINYTFFGI
ncbi:hypothetical protein [Lentilitoribacter sp. EG35]|uniref:hypothetical protein n=1 Tax=Lentilitoribacter sp. EG35 TaxID=3234192 RepID=UPI00345F2E57